VDHLVTKLAILLYPVSTSLESVHSLPTLFCVPSLHLVLSSQWSSIHHLNFLCSQRNPIAIHEYYCVLNFTSFSCSGSTNVIVLDFVPSWPFLNTSVWSAVCGMLCWCHPLLWSDLHCMQMTTCALCFYLVNSLSFT
jgi:hypothetical protein